MPLGGFDHPCRLGQADGHRLFDNDVLAPLGGQEYVWAVERVGCGDPDGIDIRIVAQRFNGGVGLRSVFLLPGLDHVIARRKVLDLVRSLVVGDREEGVVEDARISPHPLVDVALETDGHLDRVELLERLHPLERLADVELRVLLRQRVDVVERRIAVQDPQRLTGLDPEDVGMVLASLLVDRHRRRGGRISAGHPFLDVDEHPLERVVRIDHDFLRVDGSRVRRLAEGVRLHFDLLHGGSGSRE